MTDTGPATARRNVFARDGLVLVEYALAARDLRRMERAFAPAMMTGDTRYRPIDVPQSEQDWLAAHPVLNHLASELAGETMQLLRLSAIDERSATHWFVPWQQDHRFGQAERSVARQSPVRETRIHEFTPRPPRVARHPASAEGLARLLTLRIHLDRCDETNGPLEVVRGSHRLGWLDKRQRAAQAEPALTTLCLAERGDILVMRPLLLHRCQRARVRQRRRTLLVDYGPAHRFASASWAGGGRPAGAHAQ